jgi:predicted SAM-dependent methyltransferase
LTRYHALVAAIDKVDRKPDMSLSAKALLRFARRYPYRYLKMTLSGIEARRYIRTHETTRLLNIGAQKNRPENWFNVDKYPTLGAVYMDAKRMRRLGTGSFNAVLCEHMIEHVSKATGLSICKEIYRILKPGGVARFVTPDIQRMCAIVTSPTEKEIRYVELIREYLHRPDLSYIDAVNIMFRNYGHEYIYGREELRLLLLEAGFAITTITSASDVADPVFQNAQGHPRLLGEELNDLEAFGIEAVR